MRRTICKYLMEWWLGGDKPLPRWLERVCDGDPILAEHRARSRSITREMQRSSPGSTIEPLPFAEERIIRSLNGEQPMREERPISLWRGLALAVAAGVAVALALQLGEKPPEKSGQYVHSTGASGTAGTDPLENLTSTLPSLGAIVRQESEWKNPLDQEIEHVLSDARGAIDFLAANFLPSEKSSDLQAEAERRDA